MFIEEFPNNGAGIEVAGFSPPDEAQRFIAAGPIVAAALDRVEGNVCAFLCKGNRGSSSDSTIASCDECDLAC